MVVPSYSMNTVVDISYLIFMSLCKYDFLREIFFFLSAWLGLLDCYDLDPECSTESNVFISGTLEVHGVSTLINGLIHG